MAKIICAGCGITGYSKCPYCRNIFPASNKANDLAEMVGWAMKRDFYPESAKRPDYSELKITLYAYKGQPEDEDYEKYSTIEVMWDKLVYMMEILKDPAVLKMYLCDHDFIFAPGEVSDIDCGHGA